MHRNFLKAKIKKNYIFKYKFLKSVKNPSNGLKLDVWSNQNGVQFYTGNHFGKVSSSLQPFTIHQGFCLETHNFPDSVNHVKTLMIFL